MSRLPGPDAPPLPAWPGELVDGPQPLFVRHGPVHGLPPAVFVHGLSGSATNWTDLMALLDDRVDGIAPDLPGHGRSPLSASGRYGLDVHVGAVIATIERLDRGPVRLLGNSLGGAVATRVAARRPDLVRSLVLVSPAFPQLDPRHVDPKLALAALPGVAKLAERRLAHVSPRSRTQAVLELCYADPHRIDERRLAEEVEEAKARERTLRAAGGSGQAVLVASLRGLVTSYLIFGKRSLWATAGRVTVPVALIWGRQDRLVPVELAPKVQRAFRRARGGARLTVFADAGHVAQMELPERTAEVVRTFWHDLDPEPVGSGAATTRHADRSVGSTPPRAPGKLTG